MPHAAAPLPPDASLTQGALGMLSHPVALRVGELSLPSATRSQVLPGALREAGSREVLPRPSDLNLFGIFQVERWVAPLALVPGPRARHSPARGASPSAAPWHSHCYAVVKRGGRSNG